MISMISYFYTHIASDFLLLCCSFILLIHLQLVQVIATENQNVDSAFPESAAVTLSKPGGSGFPQGLVGCTTGGEFLDNATSEGGEHLVLFLECDHEKELLAIYSAASSSFVQCAVSHAKPVKFCGQCADEYNAVLQAWETINDDTKCKNDILASDKLQIVSQTHHFLKKLWQDGDCQNCYETDKNCSPKNSTLQFMHLYNVTMECFHKYEEQMVLASLHVEGNSSLCQNCSDEYNSLNKFFSHLPAGDLCMDIMDLMNRTRMRWKASKCESHGRALAVVISLSVFICSLPVFFYLIAAIHGTKKQQKLVEQMDPTDSRLSTSGSSTTKLYAGTTDSVWS